MRLPRVTVRARSGSCHAAKKEAANATASSAIYHPQRSIPLELPPQHLLITRLRFDPPLHCIIPPCSPLSLGLSRRRLRVVFTLASRAFLLRTPERIALGHALPTHPPPPHQSPLLRSSSHSLAYGASPAGLAWSSAGLSSLIAEAESRDESGLRRILGAAAHSIPRIHTTPRSHFLQTISAILID